MALYVLTKQMQRTSPPTGIPPKKERQRQRKAEAEAAERAHYDEVIRRADEASAQSKLLLARLERRARFRPFVSGVAGILGLGMVVAIFWGLFRVMSPILASKPASTASSAGAVAAYSAPPQSSPHGGESGFAFIQCKARLSSRYPKADMPFVEFASSQSGSDYTIASNVTLQDASGIEITRRFRCEIRHTGGQGGDPRNWKLLSLDIGK